MVSVDDIGWYDAEDYVSFVPNICDKKTFNINKE